MNKIPFALAATASVLLLADCGAYTARTPPAVQKAQTERPLLKPAPGRIAVGESPGALAVGDVNGDRKLDLLVGFERSSKLVLLHGDGRGNFLPAAGSPFEAGMPAQRLDLADVNGDGLADVALTHHDSLSVAVLLGRREGGFAPAPGSPFAVLQSGEPHNHGLRFAHVNGDDRVDLTTANNNANSVSVLLGDGRGGFSPAAGSPFPVGRAPYPPALAELNGDCHLDLVTPNINGGDLSVLLGNGKGQFTAAAGSPIKVESRPFHVAAADFNGDGKTDLAASHDDINLLTVMLGDGRGNFSHAQGSPLDLGRRAFQLVAADMDGDKHTDLVVSAATGDVFAVLVGDGRGHFRHAPGSPYATGRGAYGLAVADLNGDGRNDVVTANGGGDLSIFLRQ